MHSLRTLHLFAGAGGGILSDLLIGHKPVCAVEINEYCQQVLSARQKDGCLPWFPIFDDVTRFNGSQWRGLVDIVAGGFPCQDISSAGSGAGIEGARSSMWKHMARIIGEVRPKLAYMENSPLLVSRGLAVVLGDLAEMGYDAEWGCLSAASLGANHVRDRIWILATDSNLPQCERGRLSSRVRTQHANISDSRWWQDSPEFHRMDDVLANRLERLIAVGNGQVPVVAATAFVKLLQRAD